MDFETPTLPGLEADPQIDYRDLEKLRPDALRDLLTDINSKERELSELKLKVIDVLEGGYGQSCDTITMN